VSGSLAILNVFEGDVKLSFDITNPAEAMRAQRIVKDMIHRGYCLLVEVAPGEWQRALDFDATKNEYIIADLDSSYSPQKKEEPINAQEQAQKESTEVETEAEAPQEPPGRRGRRRGIKLETTNAIAVAASAGG
jgi:hypothetical protein